MGCVYMKRLENEGNKLVVVFEYVINVLFF